MAWSTSVAATESVAGRRRLRALPRGLATTTTRCSASSPTTARDDAGVAWNYRGAMIADRPDPDQAVRRARGRPATDLTGACHAIRAGPERNHPLRAVACIQTVWPRWPLRPPNDAQCCHLLRTNEYCFGSSGMEWADSTCARHVYGSDAEQRRRATFVPERAGNSRCTPGVELPVRFPRSQTRHSVLSGAVSAGFRVQLA